ncbi:hypothetical protein Hanom_Chr07g00640351 [Helianthus anomalus]
MVQSCLLLKIAFLYSLQIHLINHIIINQHVKACLDNQHVFISFAFHTFGFLAPEVVDLLRQVQIVMHSNVMTLEIYGCSFLKT